AIEMDVADAMAAVPAATAELDDVAIARLVLRREWQHGEGGAVVTDHEHRPVLALRRVVLEGNPRPHDLARIGVAVGARRVLDPQHVVGGHWRRARGGRGGDAPELVEDRRQAAHAGTVAEASGAARADSSASSRLMMRKSSDQPTRCPGGRPVRD